MSNTDQPITKQNITDRKITLKERFLLWSVPKLIVTIQKILSFTVRRIDLGEDYLTEYHEQKKPYIYAVWHANVLYGSYLYRNNDIGIVISSSRDGELVTRIAAAFGHSSFRGSSSRGGLGAIKAAIRHLKKGFPVCITPDGPRGPVFTVQSGLITIAQKSQVPIVPHHFECTRQWILEKSWDRHRVPKPFTTVVVSRGKPIHIPPDLSPDEFDAMLVHVETEMRRNVAFCQGKVRELIASEPS